jgi:hypothetical protein
MTTANERKARERERKRAAGLVPVEVWVPPARKRDILDAAQGMVQSGNPSAVASPSSPSRKRSM